MLRLKITWGMVTTLLVSGLVGCHGNRRGEECPGCVGQIPPVHYAPPVPGAFEPTPVDSTPPQIPYYEAPKQPTVPAPAPSPAPDATPPKIPPRMPPKIPRQEGPLLPPMPNELLPPDRKGAPKTGWRRFVPGGRDSQGSAGFGDLGGTSRRSSLVPSWMGDSFGRKAMRSNVAHEAPEWSRPVNPQQSSPTSAGEKGSRKGDFGDDLHAPRPFGGGESENPVRFGSPAAVHDSDNTERETGSQERHPRHSTPSSITDRSQSVPREEASLIEPWPFRPGSPSADAGGSSRIAKGQNAGPEGEGSPDETVEIGPPSNARQAGSTGNASGGAKDSVSLTRGDSGTRSSTPPLKVSNPGEEDEEEKSSSEPDREILIVPANPGVHRDPSPAAPR